VYHRGIPTKFRGRQYRSRLEARWATMFTRLGWPFEYEPFDLYGWIPDFLLTRANILVEVKPITEFSEQTALKIERAQEKAEMIREVLLVGCSIPFTQMRSSPQYGQLEPVDSDEGCPIGALYSGPPSWQQGLLKAGWGTAYINKAYSEILDSTDDLGWGLFSQLDPIQMADPGYRFGSDRFHDFAFNRIHQGGKPESWGAWSPTFRMNGPDLIDEGMDGPLLKMWSEAGNTTQWRAPKS